MQCGLLGRKLGHSYSPQIHARLGSYDYLLRIPIYQVTREEIEKLKEQIKSLKAELDESKATKPEDMWLKGLAELRKCL